jgi:hypothetical protein
MWYTEKHTISKDCTLELLWLAIVNVFTDTLFIWKYREKYHWNLSLCRNTITRLSLPFKNFTFYDRSSSIKREAGCRIVGNRYDKDKIAVEDARWKSGWQIKSCEGGWVGYLKKKRATHYTVATCLKYLFRLLALAPVQILFVVNGRIL